MSEPEATAILGALYMCIQSDNAATLTWRFATDFDDARAVSYRFVNGRVASTATVNRWLPGRSLQTAPG